MGFSDRVGDTESLSVLVFVFVGDGRAMVDTGGGTSERVSRAPRP